MRYFIIVVLFGLCTLIGYYFFCKYNKRKRLFSALILLGEKLTVDINFSREKLKTLIEGLDQGIKRQLYGIDNVFLDYLDKRGELSINSLKKLDFVKQDEKEFILLFLKALGRSDVDNQTKEIQSFVKRFSEIAERCKAEYKKYGSMSIKLGIVGGLFIVVLLI